MNIDYNLYKIFLYLYEEKSISKTASKLYVSQPAISYSLKELESQLGYPLFYRNSKGIEPTLAAKELYGYVSSAFNILNDALVHINNLDSLNIGCIRIGTSSQIGMFFLSDYIVEFRKDYPGIKFEVITGSIVEIMEMLEARKLDIIIDILPINSQKDVTKITIKKFDNCFLYNKNILKDVNINNEEDLKNYPLILPSLSSFVRLKLDEYMGEKNTTLSPMLELTSLEMMLDLVRKGAGIGYFVKDFVNMQSDKNNFEIITFEDKLPTVDISCVFIENFLTVATRKFVDVLNMKS